VGVTLLLAIYLPDVDLGSQLLTAFLGACLMSAYTISTLWKKRAHSVLLLYLAAFVSLHFLIWMLVYRLTGRTKAPIAGLGLAVETAVCVWIAEMILPAVSARSQRSY
jgi:hypothetical protein